jgi:hypothetical protein
MTQSVVTISSIPGIESESVSKKLEIKKMTCLIDKGPGVRGCQKKVSIFPITVAIRLPSLSNES